MQEKLKDMSPEEIAELQKQNCPFCLMAQGKIAPKKIFEDDKCLAVLELYPANPGHVVLFPKEHYSLMAFVPEDILGHLSMVAKAISNSMLKALNVKGTNIFIASGGGAGQKFPHFIMNIIPRKEDDGLKTFDIPEKSLGDISQIAEKIRSKVKEVFKIKEDIVRTSPEETKKIEEENKEEEKSETKEKEETETKEEDISETKEKPKKTQQKKGSKNKKKKSKKSKKKKSQSKIPKKQEEEKADLDDIADLFK